ncbi:MAG: dTMP kinase [Bacilli bacterium]|nr:dTMP kinase [Bacilli bacterium]
MKTRGIFISLEGIDGSGKTTLKEHLVTTMSSNYEIIGIREPGGTPISEKIRDILLDVRNKGIMDKTEALLYAAARSQLVEEVIRPSLDQGKIIIADRFMDSTIAYQGYGRGIDLQFLEDLNRLCTGGLKPDITFLLDINPEEGQRRRRNDIPDRLEKEGIEFQNRIRDGYLKLWEKEPSRIKKLDGTHTIQELVLETYIHIRSMINKIKGGN